MSEEVKPEGDDGKAEFKAPTSQEEFDRMIGARLERERSKFADYDDIRAKAAEFDKAQEASKSELQKERERAEAAEQRASVAEQAALRTRISVEEGVIPEVLHGTTEEEMRASAKRVIEWRDSGKKAAPAVKTLKSGSGSDKDTGTSRAAAALRQLRQGA